MISLLILLVLNSVSTEPIQGGQCGISNAPASRITGGHSAKLGAWPWMAIMAFKYLENLNRTVLMCGASLISKRYVVTAAHCVWMEPISEIHRVIFLMVVRLGEFEPYDTDDGANPVDYDIEKIIFHEDHNPSLIYSDIALVRLASDVTFTEMSTYSDILLEVEVPIVNNTYCRSVYEEIVPFEITKLDMCAGEPGKDSCTGDSGGPLMVQQSGVYYLIGIVKAGHSCGLLGYPGIYTRVTAFIDWIEDIINEM